VAFTGRLASGEAEAILVSSSSLDSSGADAGGSYVIWSVGL
jgi:hypothetical protein